MNNLLKIKMKFTPEKKTGRVGDRNLTSDRFTDVAKVEKLILDLKNIKTYYSSRRKLIKNALVDVCYNDIIAKSNRICELLKGDKNTEKTIVGARFSNAKDGEENHIITHYIEFAAIDATIVKLEVVKNVLQDKFNGKADKNNFNKPQAAVDYRGYKFDEKQIRNIIIDCSVVEAFDYPCVTAKETKENMLVTFYRTELRISEILTKIGGNFFGYSFYGDTSLSVNIEMYNKLVDEIPYLISMVVSDISSMVPTIKDSEVSCQNFKIKSPTNEPTIGVIDTLFDKKVYFSEWVDYQEVLEFYEENNKRIENYIHGTEVTSIIVDGPRFNPDLDDGCGNFKVKHFGVCCNRISPTLLMKKIKKIVDENPQIHVWNLSLGTEEEVSKNFISYDAAILDELQAIKNIIFVISGTNDFRANRTENIRIGSPADSLNSLVVNAVKRNNTPVSYARKGKVLSFFNKPDVSYYGGDIDEQINVCSPNGVLGEMGTSFAAPWISRKLCYLIDVMGLPKEVAKALIIDAAAGWEYKQGSYKNKDLIGFGVVPIKIEDILKTDNSEIKFVLYETSKAYKTANYAIPVPKNAEGRYPYIARATLCYFPTCRREQGVDYTDRELSLKFGKVGKNGNIEDINKNIQDDMDGFTTERKSRQDFRKWENTKFISSLFGNNRSLKAIEEKFWGFCVTSKERTTVYKREKLNFGAVVTLREINNVNRIEEFKHACLLRGYIVTELEIDNQIDIYESSQEDIVFDS